MECRKSLPVLRNCHSLYAQFTMSRHRGGVRFKLRGSRFDRDRRWCTYRLMGPWDCGLSPLAVVPGPSILDQKYSLSFRRLDSFDQVGWPIAVRESLEVTPSALAPRLVDCRNGLADRELLVLRN